MTKQKHRGMRGARPLGALCAMAAIGAAAPLAAQNTPAPAPAQAAAAAAANINITPRRVIFDRNKRTEAVYVFNQGTAAVTVDVTLVDNFMLRSGEIVPVARAAEKGAEGAAAAAAVRSAKPLLLVAPSRLTLPPGQGKTIRVRATQPEGTEAAEYRTHLTVTSVPPADTGLTAEQAAAVGRGELVFRVQSIFGLSIPLIVRAGTPQSTASFGAIALGRDGDQPVLEVPIRRAGTASIYGNLEVRSGKDDVVGTVRGLAVYPEIGERAARIPLTRPLRKGETVSITFFTEGGKDNAELARGSFTAP